MSTKSKVLNQLKILEILFSHSDADETIELTLAKIIDRELATAQNQIAELEKDLQQFEKQYQMSSAEFYRRFHAGEIDDDIDLVEWNAFYEMWQSLNRRIDFLQSN